MKYYAEHTEAEKKIIIDKNFPMLLKKLLGNEEFFKSMEKLRIEDPTWEKGIEGFKRGYLDIQGGVAYTLKKLAEFEQELELKKRWEILYRNFSRLELINSKSKRIDVKSLMYRRSEGKFELIRTAYDYSQETDTKNLKQVAEMLIRYFAENKMIERGKELELRLVYSNVEEIQEHIFTFIRLINWEYYEELELAVERLSFHTKEIFEKLEQAYEDSTTIKKMEKELEENRELLFYNFKMVKA